MSKNKIKDKKIKRIIKLINNGKLDKALEKANVNDVEDLLVVGVLFGQNKVYDVAEKIFDFVVHINPNDARAWYNKGVALVNLGKHDEAIKCFDKAIKINPNDAKAWYNKGVELVNLGKYDEAIKCFDKAIKIDPNDAGTWSNKGAALGNLGKYDEAIKCFDKAIKIDPTDDKAWYNKGTALGNFGKYDEAIKYFDKAIKIDPNDDKVWYNKGAVLRNLGKYDEEIKCYDKAIKINPKDAKAYYNKGVAFLSLRKYDNAKTELGMAKELFLDSGIKNEANKARKLKSLAKNASELIPKLKPLDEQFKSCLYSSSLKKLKDKSLKVSEEMKSVIKKFGKSKLPEDVILLLESKKICFTTLSNSLEFKKVNLNKLRDTEGVFEDWNLDTFATAVNFLIAFIYGLKKYKSFEEINRKVESQLLQVLKTSNVLDGELTEEIAGKFKGEPYVAKPISTKVEKNPKIIYKYIADTKREWVRFCLVQLDFSIEYQCPPKKFGHVLNEKDKIKNKVFKALKIARKNKVDLICFPELSFSKEWVKEMKNHYHDMIIIGGSYYDEGYNVCPIIIDGIYIRPPYKKHCPSPIENPKTTNRGMRSGDILYIFQTKCGRFSVLTCIDYVDQSYRICRYRDKIVDFIINPCYDRNIFRFQHRCNSDCEDYDINVIQVNKAQDKSGYGSSCIIGKEHKDILKKLRDDGLKPKDDIKYKLCQLDGEIMIIADLNIRMKAPPVNLPIDYTGRINISKEKCYKYESEHWVPLI